MSEPKKRQAWLDWHTGELTLSSAGGKNEPIFLIEYCVYESLAKDHEDDWRRIQDAERALEAERARSLKLVEALEEIRTGKYDGQWCGEVVDEALAEYSYCESTEGK